jgi:hypothetical protein
LQEPLASLALPPPEVLPAVLLLPALWLQARYYSPAPVRPVAAAGRQAPIVPLQSRAVPSLLQAQKEFSVLVSFPKPLPRADKYPLYIARAWLKICC